MKKRILTDVIFNSVIFLSVFIGMTIHVILSIGDGPLDGGGIYAFRYFTNLSNVFCGIMALWTLIMEIRILRKKTDSIPSYLVILRQISVTSVAVTFATINFIFLPIVREDTFHILYSGQKILTHVLTPILSFIAFIFFAPGKALNWKENFLSVIPEFLYAILYEIEVPILSYWPDFYGFTLGGRWYAPFIVAPAICSIAYLSSFLLSLGHKKWNERTKKTDI